MGPNGSGKTTLLRALVDLGRIVSSPTDTVHLLPFLSSQTKWEPTRFSLEGEGDFLAPGETPRRYRYELAIGRQPTDDGTEGPLFVSHEALVHFPRGRRRRLLERRAPRKPIYVSRDFGLTARDDRLKGVEPNRSAIATLALVNVPVAARFALAMRNGDGEHDQYCWQRHLYPGYLDRNRLAGGQCGFQTMGPGTSPTERPGD